jgi:hypothetical protein
LSLIDVTHKLISLSPPLPFILSLSCSLPLILLLSFSLSLSFVGSSIYLSSSLSSLSLSLSPSPSQDALTNRFGSGVKATVVHPGAVLTPISFAVVTAIFLLTVLLTVMNILYNPHPILSGLVTGFCVILTVLTAMTYTCAYLSRRRESAAEKRPLQYDMY